MNVEKVKGQNVAGHLQEGHLEEGHLFYILVFISMCYPMVLSISMYCIQQLSDKSVALGIEENMLEVIMEFFNAYCTIY